MRIEPRRIREVAGRRREPHSARIPLPGGLLLAASLLGAAIGPGTVLAGSWPLSSREPARPLPHATLDQRCRATGTDPDSGYRFVVFGNQRALADGEWPALMNHVGKLAKADPRILFMLDTGDFVQDGSHSDQFRRAERILAPAHP